MVSRSRLEIGKNVDFLRKIIKKMTDFNCGEKEHVQVDTSLTLFLSDMFQNTQEHRAESVVSMTRAVKGDPGPMFSVEQKTEEKNPLRAERMYCGSFSSRLFFFFLVSVRYEGERASERL